MFILKHDYSHMAVMTKQIHGIRTLYYLQIVKLICLTCPRCKNEKVDSKKMGYLPKYFKVYFILILMLIHFLFSVRI